MAAQLTRRRFLSITACTALVPGVVRADVPVATWRGAAMGAGASLKIAGLTQDTARPVFAAVETELARLEDIFSLYRPESALMRLNRDGALTMPPAELVGLLTRVDAVHATTGGAFDPTIQPLWQIYASAARTGALPSQERLSKARMRTGWGKVRFDAQRVSFAAPGMALTLNGIAQGYVTDQIAMLLRAHGLENVLVDIGETHALGHRPGGGAWRVGIAAPDGALVGTTGLTNRAIATSAPLGTVLDQNGQIGHIIDPRSGTIATARPLASVSADTATLADALSTAFCLLGDAAVEATLTAWPDARVEVI